METYFNRLKASLFFQIIVGVILALVMTYFTISASSDAGTASALDVLLGVLLGAAMVMIPLVLVPVMSLREIAQYHEEKSLFITHVHSFIVIAFVFFPLAFWQIYLLKKIKALNADTTVANA